MIRLFTLLSASAALLLGCNTYDPNLGGSPLPLRHRQPALPLMATSA